MNKLRELIREEINIVLYEERLHEGFFQSFLDKLAATIKNDNLDFLVRNIDRYDPSLGQRIKSLNLALNSTEDWIKRGDKLSQDDKDKILKLLQKANK